MTRALLFDLDDTLVVEEAAAVEAFAATARWAAARCERDAGALATRARAHARELWRAGPAYGYCRRIGMSSWEGLWCRYEGDGEQMRVLRSWAPGFRLEAWRRALADQGIDDEALAAELGERFGVERRALCETFADAPAILDAFHGDHAMALVTNGASCLQREKLAASGLADRFDAIVVSGDLGRGKPDPTIFAHAVRALGAEPRDAVMVGDNLAKDVDGALAAGLRAVWLNREGDERPPDRPELREIASLAELPAMLA
ncbi:MAG TPA: HAD family hydrolase [Solirubrobacteraceae bacterium]